MRLLLELLPPRNPSHSTPDTALDTTPLDTTPLDTAPLDTVVVIDVLRMTTTACALFSRGLSELAVVAAVKDARTLAAAEGALLLGERGGVRLPGFDGGNSPLEYQHDLSGQRAVLCTSNGSRAVERGANARHLLLGSIVNAPAVARKALSVAQEEIRLVCAGTDGEVSLDDVLGAACIARELVRLEPALVRSDLTTRDLATNDGVKLALKVLSSTPDLEVGLKEARHAALLTSLGFGEDVRFAARLNSLEEVPQRVAQHPARFKA